MGQPFEYFQDKEYDVGIASGPKTGGIGFFIPGPARIETRDGGILTCVEYAKYVKDKKSRGEWGLTSPVCLTCHEEVHDGFLCNGEQYLNTVVDLSDRLKWYRPSTHVFNQLHSEGLA
ncbi:MAG: hypothetical protein WCC95_18420 [Candidatus Sulfotelmatobacter sp.]